jgi:hypothetical protein
VAEHESTVHDALQLRANRVCPGKLETYASVRQEKRRVAAAVVRAEVTQRTVVQRALGATQVDPLQTRALVHTEQATLVVAGHRQHIDFKAVVLQPQHLMQPVLRDELLGQPHRFQLETLSAQDPDHAFGVFGSSAA